MEPPSLHHKTFVAHINAHNQPSITLAKSLQLPTKQHLTQRLLIGRREWWVLPECAEGIFLGKIDTGAYTSSLHARDIVCEKGREGMRVRFITRNHYGKDITCCLPLFSCKKVRSSNGLGMERYIVRANFCLGGGLSQSLLLSLTDRSEMRCPLLIGRRALSGLFVVDSQSSFLFGTLHQITGKAHHSSTHH